MAESRALAVQNSQPGDMDMVTLGTMLAKSGYFADARDAAQSVVKVLAGRELGVGPIAAMTGIYIVKGRVTLSAVLMAGVIKKSRKYNYRIIQRDETTCILDFYEDSEKVGRETFTIADAKRAGLADGENYRKYPKNMLFSRAMSNGAKAYCPDAFNGAPVYTPDELGERVDGETGEVIVETTARVVEAEPVQAEPPKPLPVKREFTRDELIAFLDERVVEAKSVGIPIDDIPFLNVDTCSDAEIIEAGKSLKKLIREMRVRIAADAMTAEVLNAPAA